MTPNEHLAALRAAWEEGRLSFARLVLELDSMVSVARDDLDESAWRDAFRAWGNLRSSTPLRSTRGSLSAATTFEMLAIL